MSGEQSESWIERSEILHMIKYSAEYSTELGQL